MFELFLMESIWIIMLIIFCCTVYLKKKREKGTDLEREKEYYWSKNNTGINNVIKYNFDFLEIAYEIVIVGLPLFLGIICCYVLNIYRFDALKILISNEGYWNLVMINISIITIVSIITAIKKDYYLGITIHDIMQLYDVPKNIIRVFIGSCCIFILYIIYNVEIIRSSEAVRLLEIAIYMLMFYILFNLLILIYKNLDLLINSSKKEMEAYKCLRYRINYKYVVDEKYVLSNDSVEKIVDYMVTEIIKNYRKIKEKDKEINAVGYYSIMISGEECTCLERQYIKSYKKMGIRCIWIFSVIYLITVGVYEKIQRNYNVVYIIGIIIIMFVMVLLVIMFGNYLDVWTLLLFDKTFWSFSYNNGSYAFGSCSPLGFLKSSKIYEFIGTIEDLIGFYKILLYHKQGKELRYIPIEKVKERVCKSGADKIGNAILLIFAYLDYEKYYAKLEKQKNINKIEKKAIKKLKQKDSYGFDEMMEILEKIGPDTVEYQLADSILKHAYKESEIGEDGVINPKKLRNYKFEKYCCLMRNCS